MDKEKTTVEGTGKEAGFHNGAEIVEKLKAYTDEKQLETITRMLIKRHPQLTLEQYINELPQPAILRSNTVFLTDQMIAQAYFAVLIANFGSSV